MIVTKKIQEHPDNDTIIAEVFATRIIKARRERYPTAEDLINSLNENESTKADLIRERRERLQGGTSNANC